MEKAFPLRREESLQLGPRESSLSAVSVALAIGWVRHANWWGVAGGARVTSLTVGNRCDSSREELELENGALI